MPARSRPVDDVSLDIRRGEILGLVGESGCGKSTLGKALMRLHTGPAKITEGELWFDGRDLMTLPIDEMPEIRGAEIGMVFQDPMTSLNPVQRILDHLTETIQTHEPEVSEKDARIRSEELIERLGIRKERITEYPHQMSGGMRQRVMISLALSLRAKLVIADEPTTSLDVIVEAKFLDLLKELQKEFGLTILLITHNIGVVAEVADRIAVMYAAKMMEVGDVTDVFAHPKHPYTQGLSAFGAQYSIGWRRALQDGGCTSRPVTSTGWLPVPPTLPIRHGYLPGRSACSGRHRRRAIGRLLAISLGNGKKTGEEPCLSQLR